MRPVAKGPVPKDVNGQDRTVSHYRDWRSDLIQRLGAYCCYCEEPLHFSPQVEHVSPQSLSTTDPLQWDNLLLACGPCNNAKNDEDCVPGTHFLPNAHNTLLAFQAADAAAPPPYQVACVIEPAAALSTAQTQKARTTIAMCKLDSVLVNARATDMRWHYRWEARKSIQLARDRWNKALAYFPPDAAAIEDVVTRARCTGFFSLWYDAFADVPDVLRGLIDTTAFPDTAFPGTAQDCFDASAGYAPRVRVSGDL